MTPSTLTWLDTSEHERRTVLELVSALQEAGTLDELGIGSVRDTIADVLFPGTSTIQTRAGYFLFIPWILQRVEHSGSRRPEELARRLQLELCDALDDAHGANAGVIGREARAALQRWPISVYWLGLERWGIRRRAMSQSAYFASSERPSGWRRAEAFDLDGESTAEPEASWWSRLPPPPLGFPASASFELTRDDAQFLQQRAVESQPQSYLAHLLLNGTAEATRLAETPWSDPVAATAPPHIREWLHDARLMSLVHRSATLLYNLLLARALDDVDEVARFESALGDWAAEFEADAGEIHSWDRAAMWARMRIANPRLREATRSFADRWFELVSADGRNRLVESAQAARLIRDREFRLKGGRARLTFPAARAQRRGYPTSEPMLYRWPQAKTIVSDILAGLEERSDA